MTASDLRLLDRAARLAGNGGGLPYRPSYAAALERLTATGDLRSANIWDSKANDVRTVYVPTREGR